jgi:hypothetical protein
VLQALLVSGVLVVRAEQEVLEGQELVVLAEQVAPVELVLLEALVEQGGLGLWELRGRLGAQEVLVEQEMME